MSLCSFFPLIPHSTVNCQSVIITVVQNTLWHFFRASHQCFLHENSRRTGFGMFFNPIVPIKWWRGRNWLPSITNKKALFYDFLITNGQYLIEYDILGKNINSAHLRSETHFFIFIDSLFLLQNSYITFVSRENWIRFKGINLAVKGLPLAFPAKLLLFSL